jgi:hypothetical protein
MIQYTSYSADFKKAYDSIRRELLYNILIKFGVPMKLVRLIKMCLNETHSKVRIGEHLLQYYYSLKYNYYLIYKF